MKSYTFKEIIEEDTFPNGSVGYFAYITDLEHLGAATQGKTPEEALKNLQEVLQMIVEELIEERQSIPSGAAIVSDDPMITVTI